MYSEFSGKSKDAQPIDTIQRIRTILFEMGIFVTETWLDCIDGIYTLNLMCKKTEVV